MFKRLTASLAAACLVILLAGCTTTMCRVVEELSDQQLKSPQNDQATAR